MRVFAKPVHPLKNRNDVTRVAEFLRDNYEYGDVFRILFLTGCNTGLRAGDLRNLRKKDFDNNFFDIVEQKTGKSRRIFINAALRAALNEFFENPQFHDNGETQTINFFFHRPDDYVFIGNRGTSIGVKYIHYLIREACRELNIRGNFGSHTMRKTFAFHCFKLCGDINRVKAILRHTDVKLTIKYVHDRRSLKRLYYSSEGNIETELTVKECYDVNLI